MQTMVPFEKIEEFVQEKYKCSFMSNAKWKKLLNAVGELSPFVSTARYKLIHGEKLHWLKFHEADEQFFSEPIHYKEVEWIEFPSIHDKLLNPDHRKTGTIDCPQDLSQIAKLIVSLGKFESERTDDSIRVYAYR